MNVTQNAFRSFYKYGIPLKALLYIRVIKNFESFSTDVRHLQALVFIEDFTKVFQPFEALLRRFESFLFAENPTRGF